jgi:hypothetical protein
LIAAATAAAFVEVGNLTDVIQNTPVGSHTRPNLSTDLGVQAYAFNVTAHAAVGCASAVASGGKCGPSALAGGVTSAAGPVINGHGFFFGLVANTTLGGGAAVLGGGKFENGAITGAFGYLFNAAGGRALGHVVGWVVGGIGGVETGPGDVLVALAFGHALGEIFSRIEDSLYGIHDLGVIYETDQTGSGKPYIGRSGDWETRQDYNDDGRDRSDAKIIDTYPNGDLEQVPP